MAGAVVLALIVATSATVALRSELRTVGAKPGNSAASAGIRPGDKLPTFDANGDPVFIKVPVNAPAPSMASLPRILLAVPAPGPVVSPADATAILTATWQLRAVALAKSDAHLFAAFETGAALEEDLGRCPCEGGNPFGIIHNTSVLVPRQTAWPAEFLGEVATTGSGGVPWAAYLVFRRTSPAEPWKVVLAGGYQPVRTPPVLDIPLVDAAGFDLPPAQVGRQRDLLPGQLATYWQRWKDTRRPPPTMFRSDAATTGEGALLAKHGQGEVGENGLVGHYRYSADVAMDGVHNFSAVGYDVTCGVVRNQRIWTPIPGHVVSQDFFRRNWGRTVAPGRYRAMIQTEIAEPCFFLAPGPVVVLGGEEYPVTFVAVP